MKVQYQLGFRFLLLLTIFSHTTPRIADAQIGLWSTSAELAQVPMSGTAWTKVKSDADSNTSSPDICNQDDNTNIYILAAAIVYARNGQQSYKDKVTSAIETIVGRGNPATNHPSSSSDCRTLALAREVGAYVLAADLVGYRTATFEQWLRNVAYVWDGTDGRTVHEMFLDRPNNWGTHAFGTLTCIYAYLGDINRLSAIRQYFIQGIEGPNPGYSYGDTSWQADTGNLRLINPVGSTKNGLDISGVMPDDQRRCGSFVNPPCNTDYTREALQGPIVAARVLDRLSMSIWSAGNDALYRATEVLEGRWANQFGSEFRFGGDDVWMLHFINAAYKNRPDFTVDSSSGWGGGKNAGYAYVLLAESTGNPNNPTPTPSSTPMQTNTPVVTNTKTPTPTYTPTHTIAPTRTPTPTPTVTQTIATSTHTPTPTVTMTKTAANTPTRTPTYTPSPTSTPTQTGTPVSTQTPRETPAFPQTPVATKTSAPTDTEPPTAPKYLTAVQVSRSAVNLKWEASTDNIGVTRYAILKNGAIFSTVSGTTLEFQVSSFKYRLRFLRLKRSRIHYKRLDFYQVAAFDRAGNISPLSNKVTIGRDPLLSSQNPPVARRR